MIRTFERTNHSNIANIVEDIQQGTTTCYSVAKTFVDEIRKTHSPLTVYVYRSLLFGMFQSTIGEEYCRRTIYNRLIPVGNIYVSQTKLIPTLEQVRSILKLANPQYRAVVGVLALSGMRIGEVLSRKKDDIELRKEGYARVRLLSNETKGRYKRYTFLTSEVLQWISEYHQWLGSIATNSPYLFPGDDPNTHLTYSAVQTIVAELYKTLGLIGKSDNSEHYTIHSLRTFAGDYLRKSGISEKYVLAIVGHKSRLAAEGSYLDWDFAEQEFYRCSDRLTFLDNGIVARKQVVELTRTNGKLEALLEKLLERLS